MLPVLIYDYDATLVTNSDTPSKESVLRLVDANRIRYNIPLIVLTAGSVNMLSGDSEDDVFMDSLYADRPYELFSGECGLTVSINHFDIHADVCVFGVYMSNDIDSVNHHCLYRSIGGSMYKPLYSINMFSYELLNSSRDKKMSVMYHHLLESGLNANILFVDDMNHHDFSGIENMVIDPFETVESSYYQIEPLVSEAEATQRLLEMAQHIKEDTIEEYLSMNSKMVWRRYVSL